MTSGTYDIWGGEPANLCTSNMWWGCSRTAGGTNIINPVMSARLRTAESFSFTYGRVEVRAQLPKGDWIWPAIWMLPVDQEYGSWPTSGEIDIMEATGNDPSCPNGSNVFGSTLHWGPDWSQDPWWLTHGDFTYTESLGDAMHTYGLVWTEDRLYTYIDDESQIVLDVDMTQDSFWNKGGFTGFNPYAGEGNNAPFNREFYLILNVAVGGVSGYFPDTHGATCAKPWSNTSSQAAYDFWSNKSQWYPSWNYPETNQAAMKVDSVKVWQFTTAEFEQ